MDQDTADRSVPEGWREIHPEDPFNQCNGGFFAAIAHEGTEEEPARIGFRVKEENCNHFGTCHGGLLSAALDIALGHCVELATGAAHCPTISLTVDFMRAAKLGDWVESRVRILRITRSLAFCDGLLVGPGGTVARASAVFKLTATPGRVDPGRA